MANFKPNVYTLGARPEIFFEFHNREGVTITPAEIRLSIKAPDGVITTVSGGDLTLASGIYSYLTQPDEIGWYEYELWARDSSGREQALGRGFEVVDRLY